MNTALAVSYSPDLLEEKYQTWKVNPDLLDPSWRAFFEGFELGVARVPGTHGEPTQTGEELPLQTRVDSLVYAYRTLGHTIAKVDPLEEERHEQPLLTLRELGFSDKDLELEVASKFLQGGRRMSLREMIALLEQTYCNTIGAEFMHIQNPRVRNWVRERIEGRTLLFAREEKIAMLRKLVEAESFEHFLHTRYVGQKRFSLEGGESLMVLLDTLLQHCSNHDVREIVMGMAHRGRLNVLANFMCKSLNMLFAEFSENYVPNMVGGDGDVKYHLGYQTVRKIRGKDFEVGVRLSPNPSHLEAVNPVVEGMARARQRILNDTEERSHVVPLLIHGDAAFAGQGIVAETLNLSQLPGYKTGGTVHVIVNNQIGFTTLPADARSSYYGTDVAKMIEAPVFHVNGDDPLAVAFVAQLALDFRQQFHRDVVINMYCYRRHGHNEGDEPLFTQPDLYAYINSHPSVATIFRKQLIDSGEITEEEAANIDAEIQAKLETALETVKKAEKESKLSSFAGSTAVFQPPYSHTPAKTAVSKARIEQVVKAITTVPQGFNVLPKIRRMLLEKRAQIFAAGGPFDWAYAETLAFGTLLLEGTPVRLSGQDSRRGTFSQRHSVIYDAQTRERYIPLLNLAPEQARFCVYNSLLSEAAVLGFDYGYSLDFPDMLCLWEAQFGDFANGAQNIIDQFIVSAESKWQRPSGLVMLLPHGYEGQGPEHSSARMERFLQLCAEDNIQVCNLTTPAQYFHALRRQMKRGFRKPLVIMTPKSLLRAEQCVSKLEDFTKGQFVEIYPDTVLETKPEKVERVIFCTGKVYYDLLNYRTANKIKNAAIIRLEQLYPLHIEALKAEVAKYPKAKKLLWCQEESQNMGAWGYINGILRYHFEVPIWYAGRNASASPAVGALAIHRQEQKLIIEDAFNL